MELGRSLDRRDIDAWFVEEVLPLEPMLTRLLRRNWRDVEEVADLRQEAYVKIYEAAQRERPSPVKPFLIMIARNLMIDRLRRNNVVSIETMNDLDWSNISEIAPSPEDRVAARQQLTRMQAALDQLPPRCREVIVLRRVHGFSQREVAKKMGIKEETVENQVMKGMRVLADAVSDRRGNLIAGAKRLEWRRKD
ncbi:MAG TPA: RNA polymerase sigma factor [Rhizomicrobium sp.]|nr:RNA polymerase sigma factor [Rhizomicrobium sp.]